jgi:hypothetical protein
MSDNANIYCNILLIIKTLRVNEILVLLNTYYISSDVKRPIRFDPSKFGLLNNSKEF